MTSVDLDAPEHALCSEALAKAERLRKELHTRFAESERNCVTFREALRVSENAQAIMRGTLTSAQALATKLEEENRVLRARVEPGEPKPSAFRMNVCQACGEPIVFRVGDGELLLIVHRVTCTPKPVEEALRRGRECLGELGRAGVFRE